MPIDDWQQALNFAASTMRLYSALTLGMHTAQLSTGQRWMYLAAVIALFALKPIG